MQRTADRVRVEVTENGYTVRNGYAFTTVPKGNGAMFHRLTRIERRAVKSVVGRMLNRSSGQWTHS